MREWNWTEAEVLEFCASRGVDPPARTDCAVCFYQTLREWWNLWKYLPEMYEQGEYWERLTGHTFRSPGRDSQPASLSELRVKFEQGYVPSIHEKRSAGCRVCSS